MLKTVLKRKAVALALALFLSTMAMLVFTGIGYCTIDPQDDWATLKTSHFMVHAPKHINLDEIGRVAEDIYSQMAPRYHYREDQRIDLYLYTGRSAFLYGSPSDDAAGYASPRQNLIAILLGVGNSTMTLGHEINHIIFMQSAPRIDTVPDWFIEGLAIYESQPGVEATKIEKYALVRDIPDLAGDSRLNDDETTKEDYAQGYLMINFIIEKFGKGKLYDLIYKLQGGADFDTALLQALGRDQDELNAMWKKYARSQINVIWLTQLRHTGWYLLAGLVILAVVVIPIRKRKRLRDMEDEEDYVLGVDEDVIDSEKEEESEE